MRLGNLAPTQKPATYTIGISRSRYADMTPKQFSQQIDSLIARSQHAETQLLIEAMRLQTQFLAAQHVTNGRVPADARPLNAYGQWDGF